jgi:hypothetical protein
VLAFPSAPGHPAHLALYVVAAFWARADGARASILAMTAARVTKRVFTFFILKLLGQNV